MAQNRVETTQSMYARKLAETGQQVHQVLTAHNINLSPQEIQAELAHDVSDVRKMLKPRLSERVMTPLSWVPRILNPFAVIASLNLINLRRSAINVATEGLDYQAATGKNPNLGLPMTLGVGIPEIALSVAEQEGALVEGIASLGLGLIPGELLALGADVVIDTGIAKGIEAIKFPRRSLFGTEVEHRTMDHVVELSGAAPVIPVAMTLTAFQIYGRRELRKITKGNPEQMNPQGQDILVHAAALKTLRRHSKGE